VRSPLLHFAALGCLIHVATGAVWPSPSPRPEPILVRAETEARIRADWLRSTGRAPTAVELERLIADLVDDELLFRAALARGLQHEDAVVARRLIANRRFVELEDPALDARADTALLRDAHALELERTDLVVRRRLVERMRAQIVAAARARDDALASADVGTAEADERGSARIRFRHVFLSRDARGERLTGDAAALFAKLSSEALAPDDAERLGLGDPSLIAPRQPWSSERELDARLGAEFAAAAFRLPAHRWSAPIPSSYGLHLLWVEDRVESRRGSGAESDRRRHGEDPAARDRAAVRDALAALRRDVEVVRERPFVAGPATTR